MSDPAPRKSRATPMLLALIAVFTLPIALAWWLAVVRPPSSDAGLLNHGLLIRPPLDVAAHRETQALDHIQLQPSEWAMIYVGSGPCETVCEATMNKLATIRSVLGQGAIRVRLGALIDKPGTPLPNTMTVADESTRSFVTATIKARVSAAHERGIVFMDWRRQVMMVFDADAPPGDIKKDIKRLLRASKIK